MLAPIPVRDVDEASRRACAAVLLFNEPLEKVTLAPAGMDVAFGAHLHIFAEVVVRSNRR